MQKIDKIVWKETKYIAVWILIFSAVMQAVFLVIGKWDYTVLLGNLLSGVAGILNFLLMGLTVQRAVEREEKEAKQMMKLSGLMRTFLLFVVTVAGVLLPCFSIWTVLIPLFFPRVAIALRPIWDRKAGDGKTGDAERAGDTESTNQVEESDHED